MTYDDAIAFWYGRINYEVRAAGPSDLKLERMRALLKALGDPHDRCRLVHVTGTKGKGSTCAMIAAVLRAAGLRVGLFTSPHLEHVEERVRVNGTPISHAELAARMDEIAPVVLEMERSAYPAPTFFEIGTALGFLHFSRRRCDVAVVEVGLGGRFDSTNVCRPLVSVVTNVGFDHVAQLGNTLEAIAFQKAGIVKRRVPVVSGVTQPGARDVVRREAARLGSPLIEPDTTACPFPTNLLGAHQVANAAVAVAALRCLSDTGMSLPPGAVARGLAAVEWPCRVEKVGDRPVVILDTAHNVPSAEALVATLRATFPVGGTKRVVFAVSSDKEYAAILRILAAYFDHFHLCRYGNNPRAVSPEKLAAQLPDGRYTVHATSGEAWGAARAAARPDDLVCVTGSVFLAGELRGVVA
jgi:dihydrofolate synthase/folylpolyglutamate synthase